MKDNMIHIRLSDDLHKSLKIFAVSNDKSINSLVGEMIENYLIEKKGLVK